MVMKCTAVCLVVLALLGSLCDAQWTEGLYKPSRPKHQKPSPPNKQEPKVVPIDPQQSKQTFEAPLKWSYPVDPTPKPQPEVPFELRYPVPAASVAVECREKIAHVEVKRDMFGIGQLINPNDLKLGECSVTGEDSSAQVLIFQIELHDCGSSLEMREESLVYTFTLNYNPGSLGESGVVRTSKAVVIAECHYPRKHNVSSGPIDPVWIPFSTVKVAEEFLYFTLTLMTDNWQNQRPSYQYFLGNIINIEAAVMQYYHVPLRVYVHSCVATLSPDPSSNPRYAFIENHGCLLDARITGSSSRFLPRSAENKLQFQLEAFRFQGADSGLLYITCHLKATSTAVSIDGEHRACSYINGWKEASGVDSACASCESSKIESSGTSSVGSTNSWVTGGGSSGLSTPGRKIRDVAQSEILEWEGDVTLGPIPIHERPVA